MAPKTNSKEKILDAVEAIVIEQGAANLTIDGVAQRAGLTKGGVIYNFGSKEELLKALLRRSIAGYEQASQEGAAHFSKEALDPMLAAMLAIWQEDEPRYTRLFVGMLSVFANAPDLIDPLREFYQSTYDRSLKSPLGTDQALLLNLAADGYWFIKVLNLVNFQPEQQTQITELFHRMVRQRVLPPVASASSAEATEAAAVSTDRRGSEPAG